MYKLKGTNNIMDIKTTILENRNIKDKSIFLNPLNKDVILDPHLLKNMQIGVNMFIKHVKERSEVAVLVDSDP